MTLKLRFPWISRIAERRRLKKSWVGFKHSHIKITHSEEHREKKVEKIKFQGLVGEWEMFTICVIGFPQE